MLLCMALASASDIHTRFGVMLDAGSTGTRVHVYKLAYDKGTKSIVVLDDETISSKPGVSSFASNPEEAGSSLKPLFDFALSKLNESERTDTPVFFKATGGLRLLAEDIQEKILESVRIFIQSYSTFKFDPAWAKVIDGRDEGVFAWIHLNYLLGAFNDSNPNAGETKGVLDMGGASTQVAFVSSEDHPEFKSFKVSFAGKDYNVYTYSHLGFGLYQAFARHKTAVFKERKVTEANSEGELEDPCYPVGYLEERTIDGVRHVVVGTGDVAACRELVLSLLNLSSNSAPCSFPVCSMNGAYQPIISGDIYAFAYYAERAETLGLAGKISIAHLEQAGEHVCALTWDEVRKSFKDAPGGKYAHELCFAMNYFPAILHRGLGLPRDVPTVTLTSYVNGVELGWSLGAVLYEMSTLYAEEERTYLQNVFYPVLKRFDEVTKLPYFQAASIGTGVVLTLLLLLVTSPSRATKTKSS
eukprot:CAMPEP_0196654530 /NCGR_PEP_ID=MMETSP1086-20130531/4251_1 /TAXON_ID=77921 /ORGANISM="Cyanoptyche  gloeocystis , Strain SAG4.97" /LENGTH=470 /DNA_ID=CAMNT_0041986351 /DNA_START=48 /DNA_END=1460 /DNA_ORIENTATION=+